MNREIYRNPVNLRCGISIFPTQDKAFDKILADLLEKAPARFILLTDISGQIVSARGDRGKSDLIALGSLAAGDLAASQEIARISGEYQQNQMIMREGTSFHTIIYEAGPYLVLLLQVSSTVPLGWVRMLVKDSAEKISRVVSAAPENVEDVLQDLENNDLAGLMDNLLEDAWKG